jgi:phosphoglucomutase
MIKNAKTIDPKDDASTKVIQLETAMGAAIECFKNSGAVCVDRDRFAPVKKCGDLLTLRSDVYSVTPDSRLVLSEGVVAAPEMDIDGKKYKLVDALERALALGTPSLKKCTNLKVDGYVYFSRRNILVGTVKIVNSSKEPKVLPPGKYQNCTVDLSAAPGLGALLPAKMDTAPIAGQKPGTSGLRKKTKEFMTGNYLKNFVQSTLNAVKASGVEMATQTLSIGGDGRYFNDEAIQIIIKMAVANGVNHILVGENGLLSTPAMSAVIRERGPSYMKSFGGFILTASHNPGGPNEDFGIKYNVENGGPAPEGFTDLIYKNTTTLTEYLICPDFPTVDLNVCGITKVESSCGSALVTVEVIDAVEQHVDLLKSVFDFGAIKKLLDRPDFSMVYDCMHGVQGPYARAVFVDELEQPQSCLLNAVPKDDFGGHHADPNLTYAVDLVDMMGLDKDGSAVGTSHTPPSFGAAADGDADRNMICGTQFFVTPSDSLAILAHHANIVPFFRDYGGLKAVARSMPTSGAVDLVAEKNNLKLFETPTGWKYFGNLMDSKDIFKGEDFTPLICGEESFGTGSNHVREKDGLWAVLFWLSILADYNKDPKAKLVSVQQIVEKHWEMYGRNYYTR